MVSVETAEKHGHKAADCWHKQQHELQGKGKGTDKSKSNVTEISESDASSRRDVVTKHFFATFKIVSSERDR